MEEQAYLDLKRGERGAIISIIVYICLSALKLIVGYLANSEALKADGLNCSGSSRYCNRCGAEINRSPSRL